MTKQQEISRRILDKIADVAAANGSNMDGAFAVRAGFDHVLGEGAYDRLVSDLYDNLRAKAA
jgi:hypothetical protein